LGLEKNPVASLQLDPKSGRYRIRFGFGGQEYKRSLRTRDEGAATVILGRVEETLRLMEQGRIELPANVDPGRFILSDGKRNGKTIIQRPLTLDDLFARYRKGLPEGVKESNTMRTERLHCKHLLRILGMKVMVQSLGTGDFQKYANERSQEKGKHGSVRPQTIKKELDTIRVIWNWAVGRGYLKGAAPIKGVKLPKGKERMPFQTWDEIQAISDRGGLTAVEEKELWDCLFLTTLQISEVLQIVQKTARIPFIYPMFVLAAHAGARRSEMMRSRVEDFDFENQTVLVREADYGPAAPHAQEVHRDGKEGHWCGNRSVEKRDRYVFVVLGDLSFAPEVPYAMVLPGPPPGHRDDYRRFYNGPAKVLFSFSRPPAVSPAADKNWRTGARNRAGLLDGGRGR
jgi:integrase